jgi:predicted amidophosphoribosyltransferase
MIKVTSRTSTCVTTHAASVDSASGVLAASHPARRQHLLDIAAEVFSTALSWVLPARCAGCDRDGVELCSRCRCAMLGATGVGTTSAHNELSGPRGTLVAMSFTGAARRVILGLKYRNRRILARYLAGLMVNRIIAAGLRPGIDINVVTWAPTSARRRRQRGYDHAELIARQVAAQLRLPARRLLQRHHSAAAQTGAGRAERLRGPSFAVSPRADGARVLVVDDVVTTGATLDTARDALKAAGARRVIIAAVAATPSAINDHRDLDHRAIERVDIGRGGGGRGGGVAGPGVVAAARARRRDRTPLARIA